MINKVPSIRLEGFSKPWKEYRYSDLFSTRCEKNKNMDLPILSASQKDGMVVREENGIDIKFEASSVKGYKIVYPDDFVVHLRSFQGGFAFSSIKGACSPAYTVLIPKRTLLYPKFFEAFFTSDKFIHSLRDVTYGIRDGRSISVEDWLDKKVLIPDLDEQKKIADFLDVLKERINKQEKIISETRVLFNNLVTSLDSQRFISTSLSSLLKEHIAKKGAADIPICSVAVDEGVIEQYKHLGKNLAASNTSNYHVVEYGDVVYTKSPTGKYPYGIIKQSHIEGCVCISPLYAVYKPISFEAGFYLDCYFSNPRNTNNYLYKLVEKGAKNTMNITNQRALEGNILFPKNKEDLTSIVSALSLIKQKLEKEKKLLLEYEAEFDYYLFNLYA